MIVISLHVAKIPIALVVDVTLHQNNAPHGVPPPHNVISPHVDKKQDVSVVDVLI